MRDKKYQASHHNYPCVFCGRQDETIVGHHIRIKGTCGVGMKPSDIQVIPVCHVDHGYCHSGLHSIERQTEKLLEYWLERLTQEHGFAKAIEKMGKAYWKVLL